MEQCGEDHIIGERPDDCFACLSEQRDELLSALKALRESFVNLARTRGEDLREEASHRVRNALAVARDLIVKVHAAELERQRRNGLGVFSPDAVREDASRVAWAGPRDQPRQIITKAEGR